MTLARPGVRALACAASLAVSCASPASAPPQTTASFTASSSGAPAPAPSAASAPAPSATPPDAGAVTIAEPTVAAAAPPPAATTARATQPPANEDPDATIVQDPPQQVAVTARHPEPTRPDPMNGRFTLAQATAGMPPGADLVAEIETTMGTFACTMLPAEAPVTVANFVGLARGVRPFWDPEAGRWTRRPFYDGSVFHRVIPQFMVQGGDILRSGRGGPGYTIRDENTAAHNAAGQLCMANRGPNTGGAQFFITERPLPRLDGSYSVFGRCTPTDLVNRIARVPRSPRDQPITPIAIQRVTVHR